MIALNLWTACYPTWLTDDLSFYLRYVFTADRAISLDFGFNSPAWAIYDHDRHSLTI